MLPRHRAAVRRDQVGGVLDEATEAPPATGILELEVDAHVHAAVAEVAVGNAVEGAVLQQRVEVAQVGAQPLGRHGGVLPARLRRPAQRARGEPGTVLADPPERQLLGDVGDDPVRHAGRGRDGLRLGLRRPGVRPRDLREQPALPVGQLRVAGHHVGDALVEALAGDQRVLEQGGYGVGGVGHRRVAEHGERPDGRVLDQPHGRVEDQAERALGADQEAVEAAPVLGQQVLEGVAGDLATEPAELGADGAEVLVDEGIECRELVVSRRSLPRSSTTDSTTEPSASSTVSASTLSTVRP